MTIVTSTRDGAVATITLDRAAEGNLLSVDGVRELAAAFRAAGAERRQGDRAARQRRRLLPRPRPEGRRALADRHEDAHQCVRADPRRLRRHGECAPADRRRGAGRGASVSARAIASACDLTIAHDSARFSLPEMEKDLPPTLAVSALMPRVPRKALAWMVYSMDELDARAAQQIGIVSKVVPAAQVEGEVAKLLATMTARTPEALVADEGLLPRRPPHMEPRGMADYAANLLAAVLSSAGK